MMRNRILLAALVSLLGASTARALCDERELSAGTVLADGTIAGEKEALSYFKEKEPELSTRLSALPAEALRKDLGKYFEWFQRVGPCRQQQKKLSIRQLKAELQIRDSVGELRATTDLKKKTELKTKVRGAVSEIYDAEQALMEREIEGLKGEVAERQKILEERRRKKQEAVDHRLKELLKSN